MCGIAALWGSVEAGRVQQIIARQKHRGPDGAGFAQIGDERAAVGHCRLAIIDPENGHQPMQDPATGATLVANAMIYNDRELRRRNGDAPYRTQSDSESILRQIAEGGPESVAELDGMFAFVVADEQRLIAARDPVGIKPLYMASSDDGIAFASEIKALVGFADRIEEFPAGHYYDSANGFTQYYTVPDALPSDGSLDDALHQLRHTLEAAVVKRLRSDVPFGALLSGGLDSSIIAAIAAKHVPNLKTFAVGTDGSADLAAARRVANHLGTDHHELVASPAAVIEALPRILYHLESFDQDLVRSAVPCWFVAEFAAREVKVVLTGEGADELFAGYQYYGGITDPDALHAELRRSITSMHNINLQRVDRMTMAHGLEARVPFLDTAMIALGMSLPPAWKLKTVGGHQVEKWILRKAFEDLLPADIVWRKKLQFDQGSGFADLLSSAVAGEPGSPTLNGARSAEEAHYRTLLAGGFDHPEAVLGLVAHWSDRPAA